MKKLISLALALVLVLSLSTVAFAADYDDKLDVKPVVPKTYEVNNGTAPAETFTFSFTGVSYKNGDGEVVADATIPAIDNVTIPFDAISQTASKSVTVDINANDYELGVYTYKVTEVAGSTAGVTYSGEELYLVLTILRDESSNQHYVAAMHYQSATGNDKRTGFTNKYDAGSLSVTKDIKGNMADMNKEFAFTIVFTAPTGETVNSAITVTKPDGTTENITFATGKTTYTYTINLGDDDTVNFTNIPEGVTYTVSEEAENYTSDHTTEADGSISVNDKDVDLWTNTLTNEVDTGISMDSMPYILLLAVACMGLFVFISKKRMMREF